MRTRPLPALLLLLPLAAAGPAAAQQTRTTETRTTERTIVGDMAGILSVDGKTEHVWIDSGRGIEVRSGGEVALREDAADVESVPEGGYLVVQQRRDGALHRAEWRPAPGGGVRRAYTVDGRARDFAEARPWLERFFPEMVRTTSIGAKARFQRVLARRGVDGVLAEAAGTGNDVTRRAFLQGLLERDLTPAETQRFLRVAAGVGSSSDRRDLLLKTADRRTLSAEGWAAWLDAAGSVGSSSDRRDLLRRAVAKYPAGRTLPEGFFRSVDGMSSSSDRRDVLTAVVASRGGDAGVLARALATAGKLPSSSDRRDVLTAAARVPSVGGALPQYLQAVAGMPSPSDQRDALAALIRNRTLPVTSTAAVAWLGAVKQVRSDSDKATLLMSAIGRLPTDRATRAAFSEAVETISSDSDYNRVATAYLRSQAERR